MFTDPITVIACHRCPPIYKTMLAIIYCKWAFQMCKNSWNRSSVPTTTVIAATVATALCSFSYARTCLSRSLSKSQLPAKDYQHSQAFSKQDILGRMRGEVPHRVPQCPFRNGFAFRTSAEALSLRSCQPASGISATRCRSSNARPVLK